MKFALAFYDVISNCFAGSPSVIGNDATSSVVAAKAGHQTDGRLCGGIKVGHDIVQSSTLCEGLAYSGGNLCASDCLMVTESAHTPFN